MTDDLDTLAADTDAARVTGEGLISDYAAKAADIVTILSELKNIDAQIDAANVTLRAADRQAVHSPNYIRHQMFTTALGELIVLRSQLPLWQSVRLPSIDGDLVPFWTSID
jgi:hypothetical protein